MTKQSRKRTATKRKIKWKTIRVCDLLPRFKPNFSWPFDNVNAIILKDR
jgi:hypothetical protein